MAAAFLLYLVPAQATLLIGPDTAYTIDGVVFDDVVLPFSSSLHVTQGGVIIAPTGQDAIRSPVSIHAPIGRTTLSGNATIIGSISGGWGNDWSSVLLRDNALVVGQGEASSAGTGRWGIGGVRLVDIEGNARIIGAYGETRGGTAIDNYSSGSILINTRGGQVIGGDGGQIGGAGIGGGTLEGFSLDVSGGSIRGGSGSIQGGNALGANSSEIFHGSISGGEMIGGAGGQMGGHGISSRNMGFSGSNLLISGGNITGGYGNQFGGHGIYAFTLEDLNLSISGGHVRGGTGGEIGGDAIRLRGGAFGIGNRTLEISAGVFDAGTGASEDGWLLHLTGRVDAHITGGLFGFENIGNGFGIFDNASLTITGWELALIDGLLTGILLDGNLLNVPVTLMGGTLSLINTDSINVPEPAAWILMLLGLISLSLVAKRRDTSYRATNRMMI